MVNKSKQGEYKGKSKKETSEEKKIKSILTNSKKLDQAKKLIQGMSLDERRELRATLNSSDRRDRYGLKEKISYDDIKRLIKLLDKEEEQVKLYPVEELRPIAWSKTVTIFDVYETDEENFVPYISPLATVGTGSSSSGDTEENTGNTTNPDSELYTEISGIIQKYYEKPSDGWNSLTNSLRSAETKEEVQKLISKQKKKKGQENTSYVSVQHEILKAKGITF